MFKFPHQNISRLMDCIKKTIATIVEKITGLSKSRRDIFAHILILFLSIRGRINFLQLERYSQKYVESTFRLHFEAYFDFVEFNKTLIQQSGSGHYVLAFDPSYIRKSGRQTPQVGSYWSGCSGRAEWGLEAGCIAVIDVEKRTAFHLDAIISPAAAERTDHDITLVDHYVDCILWSKDTLEQFSKNLAVDAYFAKKEFIERILKGSNLQIISLLRKDADLQYLYTGARTGKQGAPKKYDGKIKVSQPDFSKFTLSYEDETIRIYDAIVRCKFLNRNIRIAYTQYLNEDQEVRSYKIYFSTDLNLPAWYITQSYQLRFQQEFVFRDAKQYNGLEDCQARSSAKIEFHWNCSLTAVNIAKSHYLSLPAEQQKAFSMSNYKTFFSNQLFAQHLFSNLPNGAELMKNIPNLHEIYHFGAIAS
jgi:hypothetical protein